MRRIAVNSRRRLLIAAGLAAPFGSFAQPQGKVWRVGFLALSRVAGLETDASGAFPRAMRELGYVEGRNLVIEWRFAEGKLERLADLAAELVRLKVDAIVSPGTQAVSALQKATATIPIVMVSINDPVGSGFVASLAQPGRNITGLSNLMGDINSKHLEMLLSVVPRLARVAVLVNPANPSHAAVLQKAQAAEQRTRVKILPAAARTPQDMENAFSLMVQQNAGAVFVVQDALFSQQLRQIADLAAKHRLPSIYSRAEYTEFGGLMSYGENFSDNLRHAAVFADKILKGAKPADLPVEQPTRFEFVVNLRAARALGLAIPQSVLLRADRVIE